MSFKIFTDSLVDDYTKSVKESPLDKIDKIKKIEIPVDYFNFINPFHRFIHQRLRERILILTVILNINF